MKIFINFSSSHDLGKSEDPELKPLLDQQHRPGRGITRTCCHVHAGGGGARQDTQSLARFFTATCAADFSRPALSRCPAQRVESLRSLVSRVTGESGSHHRRLPLRTCQSWRQFQGTAGRPRPWRGDAGRGARRPLQRKPSIYQC